MAITKIDTDAVRALISAVTEYQTAIYEQKEFLLNAADVCDQAMGSDPISKRKIDKLKVALGTIDFATDQIIEEGLEMLSRDLQDLEDIYREA